MFKVFLVSIMALLACSCSTSFKKRQITFSNSSRAPSGGQIIEPENLLETMLGRKPIQTLADLYQDKNMTDEKIKSFKYYAMHPMLGTTYVPVKIISDEGNGFFVLESTIDLKLKAALKINGSLEAGTLEFPKKFKEHYNNIVFLVPNGSFNRPDFVVGQKVCPKRFFKCGTIARIYSSGELHVTLEKLKVDPNTTEDEIAAAKTAKMIDDFMTMNVEKAYVAPIEMFK